MMRSIERFLRRFGPVVAGIISALFVWWLWDQVTPVPVIHDEASYLLQTEIFASGRWTLPTPPLPEFFEQPHVQMVPAVASKYPPGHALVLTPGTLVGFPALMPLLLTAITAALLFALVTRVANPWVALFSWAFWLTAPIVMLYQPSYLSELTTTPLILGSWWALLDWRETKRRRWLLGLALMVGWGAITRPLTMLVFALPIGAVVIHDVIGSRAWRHLGLAVAVGIAVLSILPVWSARTTGDWTLSPVAKYRLDYLPFDKIGFAPDSSEPRRRAYMSQVVTETYDYFLEAKSEQTLRDLPQTIRERALNLVKAFYHRARLPLLAFAVVGLFAMSPPLRLGVVSSMLLFLAHLPYAHWPGWTLYYLETTPVVAAVTGAGLWHTARRLGRSEQRARATLLVATLIVMVASIPNAIYWRGTRREGPIKLQRDLERAVEQLPQPGILFVRYSPRIMHNPAIVRNYANPDATGIWVVHDLGERNAELLRLHPERASHFLDLDRIVRQTSRP